MSKCVSAQDIGTAQRHPRGSPRRARLYMRETRAGTWVVREDDDRRGGSFFTREAALRFIRSEFGADAQITATYVLNKEAA